MVSTSLYGILMLRYPNFGSVPIFDFFPIGGVMFTWNVHWSKIFQFIYRVKAHEISYILMATTSLYDVSLSDVSLNDDPKIYSDDLLADLGLATTPRSSVASRYTFFIQSNSSYVRTYIYIWIRRYTYVDTWVSTYVCLYVDRYACTCMYVCMSTLTILLWKRYFKRSSMGFWTILDRQ